MLLMNDISKLTLSDEEQQLVNNSDWILTKHVIIDKVYHLFGNLAATMRTTIEEGNHQLPGEAVRSTAKISKGENYLKLPYVMLDYPRCFDGGNIFAVRTMFWWGNFFSMTLHLSGGYKKMFAEHICNNRDVLAKNNFFLCVNTDEWQHHFGENNYRTVKQFDEKEFNRVIKEKEFIKLSVNFALNDWKNMPGLLERSFAGLIGVIKI